MEKINLPDNLIQISSGPNNETLDQLVDSDNKAKEYLLKLKEKTPHPNQIGINLIELWLLSDKFIKQQTPEYWRSLYFKFPYYTISLINDCTDNIKLAKKFD